jgi:transcriptional regulator with XRE-family HTH domain
MPAQPPALPVATADQLVALGERLREHRKARKISAVVAAEAAGLSRVTLHRIERGEPGVTIGSWLGAAAALGLQLELVDPQEPETTASLLPDRLRLDDYPQLRQLAWQLHGVEEVTPQEALSLYERNWRHVDVQALSAAERMLVDTLGRTLGKGRLLV